MCLFSVARADIAGQMCLHKLLDGSDVGSVRPRPPGSFSKAGDGVNWTLQAINYHCDELRADCMRTCVCIYYEYMLQSIC